MKEQELEASKTGWEHKLKDILKEVCRLRQLKMPLSFFLVITCHHSSQDKNAKQIKKMHHLAVQVAFVSAAEFELFVHTIPVTWIFQRSKCKMFITHDLFIFDEPGIISASLHVWRVHVQTTITKASEGALIGRLCSAESAYHEQNNKTIQLKK